LDFFLPLHNIFLSHSVGNTVLLAKEPFLDKRVMPHMKILLAEDDRNLGMIVKAFLDANGYQTTLCMNGGEAKEAFNTNSFDFCLFDVTMPIMDGFELARQVKASRPDIPLVFLTARKEQDDILEGFSIGADDYITKPFSMDELLARVKAIYRRCAHVSSKPMEFKLGNFNFDAPRHLLTHKNGEVRKLTSKESDLLLMLCENMGKTLERSRALQNIWNDESYPNARSMDVYITKLRKYFSDDPDVTIANVHGVGFRLDLK